MMLTPSSKVREFGKVVLSKVRGVAVRVQPLEAKSVKYPLDFVNPCVVSFTRPIKTVSLLCSVKPELLATGQTFLLLLKYMAFTRPLSCGETVSSIKYHFWPGDEVRKDTRDLTRISCTPTRGHRIRLLLFNQ